MRLFLILLFAVTFMGCKKSDVSSAASACYPNIQVSRAQSVTDAPVVVRLSGGLFTGAQLIASNGVAWNACNLPERFKQDSLKIYVSGYFLTWPGLDLMNISALPFEVTGARVR